MIHHAQIIGCTVNANEQITAVPGDTDITDIQVGKFYGIKFSDTGFIGIVDRVLASAFAKQICIISVTTVQLIITGTAIQNIIAISAVERVIAGPTLQQVVTSVTVKHVSTRTAGQSIVAATTVHSIVASTGADNVIARGTR